MLSAERCRHGQLAETQPMQADMCQRQQSMHLTTQDIMALDGIAKLWPSPTLANEVERYCQPAEAFESREWC